MMNPVMLLFAVLGTLAVTGASHAQAPPEGAKASQRNEQRLHQPAIYGQQLMSEQERAQYQRQLQSLHTEQERAQFQQEHRRQMQVRAEKQGVALAADGTTLPKGKSTTGGSDPYRATGQSSRKPIAEVPPAQRDQEMNRDLDRTRQGPPQSATPPKQGGKGH
jgi:hypothetical protein